METKKGRGVMAQWSQVTDSGWLRCWECEDARYAKGQGYDVATTQPNARLAINMEVDFELKRHSTLEDFKAYNVRPADSP